ncbi:hypothetical protein SAMN02745131_03371 [Flavisolibacter ginsengisoli DSM 18119]|jgi:hypothetical protein|uniref:Lipoprotein n=1 Tax=Flavisolibacter ginsengisoli DSM 18119 TaxID=1121884 RepID=A0A1M5DX90_9BACT|nr:hypothetical protein SAMN02745131_03371 [Flavisolibacter ginsengisoli DSM 18119]
MGHFIRNLCLALILTSCSTLLPDKHLNEKTFESNDITVKWYKVSEITSGHDFVDLTRNGYTKTILKANSMGIHDIIIKRDTITIRTVPGLIIYDLTAQTVGCYIKLDTTVTFDEYRDKLRREEVK